MSRAGPEGPAYRSGSPVGRGFSARSSPTGRKVSGVAHHRAADAIVKSDCRERPVVKEGPNETNSLGCSCSGHECGGCDRPTGHAATISPAAPRSTTSFVDQRGEAIPTPGSPTAPDRPGPVPTPDLQGFPTSTRFQWTRYRRAPQQLSDVTALFNRLPPEVAGNARSQFDRISPERSTVGYSEERQIPGMETPYSGYRRLTLRGEISFHQTGQVGTSSPLWRRGREAQEDGRDGDLFWIVTRHFDRLPDRLRFTVFVTLWGRVDSPWIFSIQADDHEGVRGLRQPPGDGPDFGRDRPIRTPEPSARRFCSLRSIMSTASGSTSSGTSAGAGGPSPDIADSDAGDWAVRA